MFKVQGQSEAGSLFHKRTSKLSEEELTELVTRVETLLPEPWEHPTGRNKALSLISAVEATVIYLRRHHVQDVIGEFYDVSQSTISRAISVLTPLLRDATTSDVPSQNEVQVQVKDEIILLDGTLIPVWTWSGHRELYSGKHKTTGFNVQVITDVFGQVITIGEPVEGRAHDMRALDECGLKNLLALAEVVIADKGYQGSGYVIPRKKPKNGQLTTDDHRYNALISFLRAPIERAIANIKTWRILHTDYRRPLKTFTDTFHATTGLYWFTTKTRSA